MKSIKTFSIISKSLFLIVSLLGIIFVGISIPTFPTAFLYFEVWANLFAFIFMLIALINEIKGNDYQTDNFHTFRITLLLSLTLCLILYYAIIAPSERLFTFASLPNLFCKLFSPILFFLDYLFFDSKKSFKISQITTWLTLPIIYVAFSYIVALLNVKFYVNYDPIDTGKFAYFFLNQDLIGLGSVCLWLLGIGAGLLALGLIFFIIDHSVPLQPAWFTATKEERKNKTYIKKEPEIVVNMGLPKE